MRFSLQLDETFFIPYHILRCPSQISRGSDDLDLPVPCPRPPPPPRQIDRIGIDIPIIVKVVGMECTYRCMQSKAPVVCPVCPVEYNLAARPRVVSCRADITAFLYGFELRILHAVPSANTLSTVPRAPPPLLHNPDIPVWLCRFRLG